MTNTCSATSPAAGGLLGAVVRPVSPDGPRLRAGGRQLQPGVRVAKVDTEAKQAIGSRYQIRSIPTLALFVNGREVAHQLGAMSASDIVRWTRQNMPG